MRIFNYLKWLQRIYPGSIWGFSVKKEKELYLTFDDGPNSKTTEWILDQLNQFNAKATFFCLGENAKSHPNLMNQIQQEGHTIGNHTMNHLDGLKTKKEAYINDVLEAQEYIDSKFFRPPYGRLTKPQYNLLTKKDFKIVFWSFLAYDFDQNIDPKLILHKLISRDRSGQIIVLHDSDKAFENLKVILPKILTYFQEQGYSFKAL